MAFKETGFRPWGETVTRDCREERGGTGGGEKDGVDQVCRDHNGRGWRGKLGGSGDRIQNFETHQWTNARKKLRKKLARTIVGKKSTGRKKGIHTTQGARQKPARGDGARRANFKWLRGGMGVGWGRK